MCRIDRAQPGLGFLDSAMRGGMYWEMDPGSHRGLGPPHVQDAPRDPPHTALVYGQGWCHPPALSATIGYRNVMSVPKLSFAEICPNCRALRRSVSTLLN